MLFLQPHNGPKVTERQCDLMLVHDNSPGKSLLKLSADPKPNIKAWFPRGAKEPPATAGDMKMRVRSWPEDPLKGKATHPVFMPTESHRQRSWQATVQRVAESGMTEAT